MFAVGVINMSANMIGAASTAAYSYAENLCASCVYGVHKITGSIHEKTEIYLFRKQFQKNIIENSQAMRVLFENARTEACLKYSLLEQDNTNIREILDSSVDYSVSKKIAFGNLDIHKWCEISKQEELPELEEMPEFEEIPELEEIHEL